MKSARLAAGVFLYDGGEEGTSGVEDVARAVGRELWRKGRQEEVGSR